MEKVFEEQKDIYCCAWLDLINIKFRFDSVGNIWKSHFDSFIYLFFLIIELKSPIHKIWPGRIRLT